LALHLAVHLEQLRPGVRVLGDPTGSDLGALLELSRSDVVVLFDYHRYQRSAADLAHRVHRAGATVLLITDDLACPVAPDAEVVLAASSTVGTTYQSMAAGFLLTELLIPLVMDAVGEPARTRMALWEGQRRAELLP
jgi:DNA-binding MurR/RpiR family transcriptional regulator